jgi:uncharacterized spore protein YtfJ
MIDSQSLTPLMDEIYSAAKPGAVFSTPVESNGFTVITASEVMGGGGFGLGSGQGPSDQGGGSGGGGGGGAVSRPVAVITIGPDGVKVKPIVDVTKVALAGITAWGAIAVNAVRLARKAR